MLSLCAALLVAAGGTTPAEATQATGTDAVVWQPGWKWTYATTFRYSAPDASATVNENLTATVVGTTTFHGQPAYELSLSGNVTGGSGSASGQNLTIKSGSVSGSRFVRRSDLALLQEHQVQHISGCAGPFCAIGVTADVDLTLDPTPTWHQHDFPLNAGDAWQVDEVIDYSGSFSYDAGSIGGSGSDTLSGTIPLDATAHVSNQNISAAGGTVSTQLVDATAGDTISRLWWSSVHKNDARDYMKLPLDDATLEMDRVLSSSSTPAPSTAISETVTPSLTCAGGTVTVAGSLSSAASGVPVSVSLDRSQIGLPAVTASTTTGANGAYSTTLTVPGESDGLQKNGSRANWGVLVSGGGAANVATVVVTPKDCSTLGYTGATSGSVFGNATVSAKLTDLAGGSGASGRTVTFSLSGGGSVDATTNAGGVATATLPVGGPPRSATVTASFAGASNLEAAQASSPFAVTPAASVTTASPSAPNVTIGDPVTFTAHVQSATAGTPSVQGGTVQFKVDGADFGPEVALGTDGSASSAVLTTGGPIALGDHTVVAAYSGAGNFGPSTSAPATFRVREPLPPTTTVISATPGSAVFGQPVELSADVSAASGQPTGTVTFSSGGTTFGPVTIDAAGHASLVVDSLPVGSHSLVATYSGDDAFSASVSSPTGVVVAKADVAVGLTSADDHTVTGESVDFTASVGAAAPGAGTPSGTVQLLVDGNPVSGQVALVDGAATFFGVSGLGAGDHTVAVSYSGDGSFRTGGASVTQHVAQAATATSLVVTPSPSAEDQPITITATVAAAAPGTGAPSGTVEFFADGETIGAAPLSAGPGGSRATLEIATLPPGAHTLTATYAGDADYLGSDAEPVSQTVIEGAAVVATTTSVGTSHNPSTFGELITFTATVAAADESSPTGSVQFSVDGLDFGDPVELVDGVAVSASLASPDPGDHTVIAAYLPTAGYSASGDTLVQRVEDAAVEVDLDSSDAHSDFGQSVTFHATVGSIPVGTGTPTGFVQFRVDGVALGDAVELVDGEATSPSIDTLAPGEHSVTALYSGDVHFAPRTAEQTQQVDKVGTTTALAASTTSPTYGDQVSLTAIVTPGATAFGAPPGTVTFRDGTTELATVPVTADGTSATASISRSDLGAGTHHLTAAYSGSPVFTDSTSATVDVTVAKKPTKLHADAVLLRINPLLGINVGVLRAVLTTADGPLPGQTVVFTKGATTVCTATTDGTGLASCTPSLLQWVTLALGGGFEATFPGTANFAGSSDHGALIQ